jgi:hypothetical protein
MSYRRIAIAIATAITPLLVSPPATATEVTPILAYRAGGEVVNTTTNTKYSADSSSTIGLIIGSEPYDGGKQFELYYSHQSTDIGSIDLASPTTPSTTLDLPLTIDYLHIGGTAPISDYDKIRTFVSGGLGFSYLSPGLNDLDSELRASFSLGIGLKWPVTDRVAVRLETRGFATLFNNNSSLFCNNGGCSFSVSGNYFTQYEVFAGVAIGF